MLIVFRMKPTACDGLIVCVLCDAAAAAAVVVGASASFCGSIVGSPNRLMYVRLPSIDTNPSSPEGDTIMSPPPGAAPYGLMLTVCRPLCPAPFPGP